VFKKHINKVTDDEKVVLVIFCFFATILEILFSLFVLFFAIVVVNRARLWLQLEQIERRHNIAPPHSAPVHQTGPKYPGQMRTIPIQQLERGFEVHPASSSGPIM
jgi:hypothetical protein